MEAREDPTLPAEARVAIAARQLEDAAPDLEIF